MKKVWMKKMKILESSLNVTTCPINSPRQFFSRICDFVMKKSVKVWNKIVEENSATCENVSF